MIMREDPSEDNDTVYEIIEEKGSYGIDLILEKIRVMDSSGGVLVDAPFSKNVISRLDLSWRPVASLVDFVMDRINPRKAEAKSSGSKELYSVFQGVDTSPIWEAIDVDGEVPLSSVSAHLSSIDEVLKLFQTEVGVIRKLREISDPETCVDDTELDSMSHCKYLSLESFKENWVKSREVIDRVLDCV